MASTDQTPEPSGAAGVVLRKWQREEIFDLVEAAGLDPAAFALLPAANAFKPISERVNSRDSVAMEFTSTVQPEPLTFPALCR